MDATFPQQDGYHFLYVMPFSSDHLLIEDTCFSNTPDLDRALIRHDIMAYLQMHNWSMTTILREESGILPMPWHWPYTDQSLKGPIAAGYNGGWFHPATGFSFPVAVRLTQTIARLHSLKLYGHHALHALWTSHQKQARFARLLNWMLFNVIRSEERWRLFKKFYQLPEKTIERFYALQITHSDQARILLGQLPRGLRWLRF
jgi:lycopene beta-cyclase